MLKKVFWQLLIATFLFSQTAIVFAQTAQSTVTQPKRTVVDFFLLLPNKYVGNFTRSVRQTRLKKFGTTDVANGYLEIFAQKENEPNTYVAVFKKDEGGYTVAVSTYIYRDKPIVRYDFLEYDGAKWTDVTKKVLPANIKLTAFGEYGNGCELPRYNRTITCRDSEGKITYLGWTGKDFVIE